MGKLQYDGQKSLFDVTQSFSDKEWNYREVAEACDKLFKKWVFQKEQGDKEGYIHWQIRGSLHEKSYCNTIYKKAMPVFPGNWSLTSTNVHDSGNQFSYVMKMEGRLEGPFSDKDMIRPPPVMTRQLQSFLSKTPYPWQVKARELVESYDERCIHYIFDPHYNSGKSIFCEWVEYDELAEEIPPFTLMEDIMQFVMCQPKSKCYLFDMPAAMKKERMHQMYTGFEMLKNGFLYDKRYNGKKKRIDRPGVIVYANNLPVRGLIAHDRFRVWYITPEKDLIKYNINIHPRVPDVLPDQLEPDLEENDPGQAQ